MIRIVPGENLYTEVETHIELCDTLVREGPMNMAALAERFMIRYQDMGSLLMTIQTDSVNLPRALELSLREYYMEHNNSPNRELESKIYGAAFSAFLIAGLDKSKEMSPMQMPAVILPVFLSLLGLQGDPDITKVTTVDSDRYRLVVRRDLYFRCIRQAALRGGYFRGHGHVPVY